MVSKSAGLTTNAIVQASPDLIPLAWDFYKNHKDKPDGGGQAALISLATQMAGVLPIKGLKNRIKKDIADASQTQMKIDTPEVKSNETPTIVDKSPADVNTPEKVAVEPTPVAKTEVAPDTDVATIIDSTPSLIEKVKKTKQKKVVADTVPVAPIEPAPMEAPVTPLTMKEDAKATSTPAEAPIKSTFDKFMETNPTVEKIQEANKVTELLQNGGDIEEIKKNTILTPEEVDMLNEKPDTTVPGET